MFGNSHLIRIVHFSLYNWKITSLAKCYNIFIPSFKDFTEKWFNCEIKSNPYIIVTTGNALCWSMIGRE